MTHIWFPILFPGGIIIFQGSLTKFHFSMTFPFLEKIVSLMKDLKHEHHQIFILRTPATIKFFHQILKNCHFGVNKKIITHPDGFA